MNIVNSGNKFVIYGDEVKTYKTLPADTYTVNFNQLSGYSLSIHNDLSVNEKIYGPYIKKVDKVLNTFKIFNRNMGIILSGPKGVGKSMFAKQLAKQGKKMDLPLIIVDSAYPGLADFISSIQQRCIVLFDEFEKNFKMDDVNDDQEKLLSLFDGIDDGKKLFVITCNKTYQLNEYLLNRPGRFHYHFSLSTPTKEEIREYMEDILNDEVKDNINKLVNISASYNFTYDILRAIAFELNNGYELNETLRDLNIAKDRITKFDATVTFNNGIIASTISPVYVDLEYDNHITIVVYFDEETRNQLPPVVRDNLLRCRIYLKVNSIKCDEFGYYIDGKEAELGIRETMSYYDYSEEIDNQISDYLKDLKISIVRLSVQQNDTFDDKFDL